LKGDVAYVQKKWRKELFSWWLAASRFDDRKIRFRGQSRKEKELAEFLKREMKRM